MLDSDPKKVVQSKNSVGRVLGPVATPNHTHGREEGRLHGYSQV